MGTPGDAPPRPSVPAWDGVEAALARIGATAALAGAGGRAVLDALAEASARAREAVAAIAGPAAAEASAAVVAVGALGRGELVPGADLDLVIVPRDPIADDGPVADTARRLWDAGLRVDLSVRTIAEWIELGASDLATATALFDATFCGGDEAVFTALRRAAAAAAWRRERNGLLARMREEQRSRHQRYGETVFLVEPDLKHGPGGLRDLCLVRWGLCAADPPDPSDRISPSFEALLAASEIRPHGRKALRRAHRFLLALRCAVALETAGPSARLSFDVQRRLPARLGIDEATAPSAAEAVVQAFFRAATDVLRFGRVALEAPQAPARPFGAARPPSGAYLDGTTLRHGAPERIARDPVEAFSVLRAASRLQADPDGALLEALAAAARARPEAGWADDPAVRQGFFDLLAEQAGDPARGLALASDLGFLDRLIPAWAGLRGRLQMEGLHAFTADRHSIRAVAFLHGLARGEHDKSFPLATALWLSHGRRRAVLLAVLLHDLGKAIDPARQEEAGAPVAERAARDLGLSEAAARCVGFLVRHHGRMPQASQRRDLTDPGVAKALADLVQDPATLADLYLVSLADMSQVRPGYLTDWKRVLLDELYLRTLRFLVARRAPAPALSAGDVSGLPVRYYDAYDPALRARHAEAVEAVRRGRVASVVEVEPGPGALRMLVVVRDAPGLLARIAEAFDGAGVEVLAADVFVVPGEPKVALDVFRVRRRADEGAGWSPGELDALARKVETHGPPAPPPASPPPRRRGAPPSCEVRFDDGPEHTIVEVRADDRPGLLRRIAYALFEQGISIHLARCTEDAGVVDDVFYVDRIPPEERDHVAAAVAWWVCGPRDEAAGPLP